MVDKYGADLHKHQYILDRAQQTAQKFSYKPMQTPLLEYSSVFERTLGEDTDVVGKELYKFRDSSQDWMTLRPEGTAGAIRALLTNRLDQQLPQRLYYWGPMFRHERPQKGRLRQFEQFGVELVGADHPAGDLEVMEMGWEFIQGLELEGIEMVVNTLGDRESRSEYRRALLEYFGGHRGGLSGDSQRRLETNPLRILDSKDPGDMEIVKMAPTYTQYLSKRSMECFEFIQKGLHSLAIPYRVDQRLVRGLDYYQHTVWEMQCTGELLGRSQATVLAGGRYDGVAERLGGSRRLPGAGWAAGVERLGVLVKDQKIQGQPASIPVLAIADQETNNRSVSGSLYCYAMRVARQARLVGPSYVHHMPVTSKTHPLLSKQLGQVFSSNEWYEKKPPVVLVVGSRELEQQRVVIRDTETQDSATVGVDELRTTLQQHYP